MSYIPHWFQILKQKWNYLLGSFHQESSVGQTYWFKKKKKKKKKLINLSLTRALLPNARELPFPRDSVNWRLELDNKHESRVAAGRNTVHTLCVPSRRCCTMAHYNRWAPGTLKTGKGLKGGKSNFHMGTFWNSLVASDPCLFSTHSPQWL